MEARRAHNPEVVGSSPTSATTKADTKRCLFFIIYLDSKFGLEPTSGSPERRKPFWGEEEQWNKRQITFALRTNKSGLERYETCDDEEAPNLASVTSSKFGRNSPGDCFVASAQSRSYLRNHQDGVCLRRLFLFSGLKPTFILHINRHRKFRCLFSVCQREKRIDLTIENMV